MIDGTAPNALVVDDDALIRMDVSDCLIDAGYKTREASDADEALGILVTAGNDIELLVTDVNMPRNLNGFGLARECALRWPHISIVVASGQETPGPDDLPYGAVFIGKPFSAEIVANRPKKIFPIES